MGLFFLDLFYLPKKLRRGGLGSRALRMAEEEAFRRGCTAATLVTVNFQAPEFTPDTVGRNSAASPPFPASSVFSCARSLRPKFKCSTRRQERTMSAFTVSQ